MSRNPGLPRLTPPRISSHARRVGSERRSRRPPDQGTRDKKPTLGPLWTDEARQELSYQRFSIPEPGEQAQLIKETYSLDAFTNGLEKLYRNIIGESTSGIDYLPTGNILDSFLMPERFRLLRT